MTRIESNFFYVNEKTGMKKNRKRLNLETSLRINNQKFCGVKQIHQNTKFAKEFSSENLFQNIEETRVYLIFVKVVFKTAPNQAFLEFLSKNGLCLRKIAGLKNSIIFEKLVKRANWLGELVSSESLYFVSTNDFLKYLEILRKCLILELSENSDAYFNVLCSKEGGVFINFDDSASYLKIRQVYNSKSSKEDILLEFSGILGNSLISLSSSLSAELAKNSSPLYPNVK